MPGALGLSVFVHRSLFVWFHRLQAVCSRGVVHVELASRGNVKLLRYFSVVYPHHYCGMVLFFVRWVLAYHSQWLLALLVFLARRSWWLIPLLGVVGVFIFIVIFID